MPDNYSSYSTKFPYCQILFLFVYNILTASLILVGLLRQANGAFGQSKYK